MSADCVRFMYIGNLEPYQGIDLLLDSFALHHRTRPQDRLVVIGGTPADVTKYQRKAAREGLQEAVDFRGAQPVAQMRNFFLEADVLVSPRIKGSNTPMKIYSYLDSGKPVVATDLFTHTQVLTPDVAVLAKPRPEEFARGLARLADDAPLRATLAERARELVRTKYSKDAFNQALDRLYNRIEAHVHQDLHPQTTCRVPPLSRTAAQLGTDVFDVLVIGAGIHGAAVAWSAARRGLRVALVEQGDFGHAASANSLKVVHGGLRYLQHLDVVRMRESIRARALLLRFAPHLVQPRAFLMPTTGCGMRSRAALGVAFALNEIISADRNCGGLPERRLPRARLLARETFREHLPGVAADGMSGGALWFDAFAEDTERLTWEFVREAQELGAVVVNYARAENLLREGARVVGAIVRDTIGGVTHEVRAATTVFTGGPWLSRLLPEAAGLGGLPAGWVRAFNLVLRRPWVGPYGAALEGIVAHRDTDAVVQRGKRNLFFVPWRGGTVVGTWYLPHNGDPDSCLLSSDEVAEAVREINAVYPAFAITPDDVTMTHVGLLPARAAGSAEPDKHTRLVDGASGGPPGLVILQGVKYTTAVVLGEQIAARILRRHKRPTRPVGVALAAADDVQAWGRTHGLDVGEAAATRLAQRYGGRFCHVLDVARTLADPLAPVAPGGEVLAAEVVHAVRREYALHLADVVLRRTDLGTFAKPSTAALEACARCMAIELGWDASRVAKEVADVQGYYRRRGIG